MADADGGRVELYAPCVRDCFPFSSLNSAEKVFWTVVLYMCRQTIWIVSRRETWLDDLVMRIIERMELTELKSVRGLARSVVRTLLGPMRSSVVSFRHPQPKRTKTKHPSLVLMLRCDVIYSKLQMNFRLKWYFQVLSLLHISVLLLTLSDMIFHRLRTIYLLPMLHYWRTLSKIYCGFVHLPCMFSLAKWLDQSASAILETRWFETDALYW